LLKSEEYNISSEKGAMEDENSFIRKQFLWVFNILVESDQGPGPGKQAKKLEDEGWIICNCFKHILIKMNSEVANSRDDQDQDWDYHVGCRETASEAVDLNKLSGRLYVGVLVY
jgi:hypothetical protein